MEWINDNCGILVLIFSIVIIALVGLITWLLLMLRSRIAVQRLNFLGSYAMNKDSKERYAELTIGNRSLNDVGLSELGIRNGKVNFPLTDYYKRQKDMKNDARIVLEQRSAISFTLPIEELARLALDVKGKKVIRSVKVYAVDLTGTFYSGRVSDVKKLMKELIAANGSVNVAAVSASGSAAVSANTSAAGLGAEEEAAAAEEAPAETFVEVPAAQSYPAPAATEEADPSTAEFAETAETVETGETAEGAATEENGATSQK